MHRGKNAATHLFGEQLAVSQVGRYVIRFDSERLAVPVLGLLGTVQLEVGLAEHIVQRLCSY